MDLIDRDELLKEYDLAHCVKYGNKDAKQQYHSYDTLMMYEIADMIRGLDAIEAEPVLHGKLLEGKAFNDQHCSVCGQRFHDEILFILPPDENGFHMPKRCPECGCYWDGGAEDG